MKGDNLKEQERTKLHNTIWKIANELRGSVDGWDFKQYILGILFYRFISENMRDYFNKAEREAGDVDFNYADISDEEALKDFKPGIVKEKGFFILPSQLFENVVKNINPKMELNAKLKEVFDKYKPEFVFHLAAQPLVRLSYENPIETYETNVMGTINILECIRKTPETKIGIMITTDKCYETSLSLVAGDVVISSPSRLAAIVGADSEGKLLTLNFIKVNIKGRLDKFYFLYLFNQSRDVQRQKERELQGTGTSMRIPVKSLERIRIPLLPIEEQKKIGQAYQQLLILQTQLRKYSQLLEATVQTSLEQILRSQSHE